MVRTPCCDKNGLKKGTWTPEEDMKLKAYVTRYGSWNWRQLPKYAGLSRCGKSCRLRWLNYLRPNVRRGNFNKEEEDTIVRLHESLGNRWSAIAAKLPGRTDNEIKNHWHTYLKKRSKQTSTSTPNGPNSRSEDLSQDTDNLEKESEANSSSTNISNDQNFGLMSPLSSESSSSATDAAQLNLRNLAENEVASWEVFEDPNGSFWTQPFLEDNYNVPNSFMGPLVLDLEFMSPNSPVVGEEFLWSYGLYDEQNNILNW